MVLVGYIILHEIAKNSKPIMKGEFFVKTSILNYISFSKRALSRRNVGIDKNVSKQLEKTKQFITFSIV